MSIGKIDDDQTNYDFETMPEFINLSGVSWDSRQDVVANLKKDDEVFLLRDYNNQYDKNAISVKTADGVQIGWVPKRFAERLAPELDAGIKWKSKVESILGQDQYELKGVLIKLIHEAD